MTGRLFLLTVQFAMLLSGCEMDLSKENRLSTSKFGEMPDGRDITKYTITNKSGSSIEVINLGGIIVSINLPDLEGNMGDIVLGYDNVTQYLQESPYMGAIVGRYANRIANGKFSISNKEYTLAQNNTPNALHGGLEGFDKKVWSASPFETNENAGVILSLISEDGDQGYPGSLKVEVTYTFDDQNQLTVDYKATTDKSTVINISQHSYFNLNGHNSGQIGDHEMMINANHYTPINDTLIPTGEIARVENTPMDFRKAKPINEDINTDFKQLEYGLGYDHNWVLNQDEFSQAAKVYAPKSGRIMEIYTDQPGIQFYSGNFIDGMSYGKDNFAYAKRGGFCLETQHFPDSPNHKNFPSTLLIPSETFESKTVFKFSVRQ